MYTVCSHYLFCGVGRWCRWCVGQVSWRCLCRVWLPMTWRFDWRDIVLNRLSHWQSSFIPLRAKRVKEVAYYKNSYPDLHHSLGVWNLPHKFHFYLIENKLSTQNLARRPNFRIKVWWISALIIFHRPLFSEIGVFQNKFQVTRKQDLLKKFSSLQGRTITINTRYKEIHYLWLPYRALNIFFFFYCLLILWRLDSNIESKSSK